MSDNVVDLVQEAQKRGKFNLADAVKGRAYPEKSVDVYLDAGSAYELQEVTDKLSVTDPSLEEYEELTKRSEELAQNILDSKITFHMRGVGQDIVEAVTEESTKLYEANTEAWVKHYVCALVAANIKSVEDKDGNVDDSKFTVEDIITLRGAMPIDGWQVLVETMQKLTLASSYFDAATDAGFLQKS